ncbi:MAG: transglycosylase SLT domain-containing protein [Gemmatimonadaceae bacterium]
MCTARPEARIRFAPIVRQLAVGIAAACTVVFTASQVHPVFLGQVPVAGRVLAAAYLDSASIRAPWLSLPEALAMRHPQFQRDVEAFAADLRGTGKIDGDRADSIAAVAVREAYHRRIPPALVLGVMLTENDRFKSHARSNVGALGLMQIMPRLWTPNLGPILGKNLKDDETNVRYGVYILKHFAKRTADSLDAGDLTRVALLSYNGCVTGSNTPDCRAYPNKVQRHIENSARESCSGRPFQECVALPLWAAMRDTTPPPMPGASLASTIPAASMDRVHAAPRITPLSSRIGHWLGGAN